MKEQKNCALRINRFTCLCDFCLATKRKKPKFYFSPWRGRRWDEVDEDVDEFEDEDDASGAAARIGS